MFKAPATLQYFFQNEMQEESGNGVTPILINAPAHAFTETGAYTGADGAAGSSGYASIVGDPFTDDLLDTTEAGMTSEETLIIGGHCFTSVQPDSTETVFSIGDESEGFIRLQFVSSGSFQVKVKDADNPAVNISFGSGKYGLNAWFSWMIVLHGVDRTIEFMLNDTFESNDAIKCANFGGGFSAGSKGLCLFADNTSSNLRNYWGADSTRVTKMKNLFFSRLPKYYSACDIQREQHNRPGCQLRSLYNAHS